MINIQNIGNNKCFKWCSDTYFDPTDHSQRGITKADKDFAKLLDFKEDIKFPAKIKHIHKIENNSINISVSGYKKNENAQSMYQNNVVKKIMLINHC